jgi:hypothetical protein
VEKLPITIFFGIINSVFRIKTNEFNIALLITINGIKIWDGIIKPEMFIDGEKVISIEVTHNTDTYKLDVWKGKFIWTNLGLIPLQEHSTLLLLDDALLYKDKVVNIYSTQRISNMNGIKCQLVNDLFFDVINCSEIDGEKITWILNIESTDINYVDLRKDKVIIPEEVIGMLFRELDRKLKEKNIFFDLNLERLIQEHWVDFDSDLKYPPLSEVLRVKDEDFDKIGAIDFIKNCLRFRDIFGKFITLNEIERNGKAPVIVDYCEFENIKDPNFWTSLGLHPLESGYCEYTNFLTNLTCQRISNYFKECNDCESIDRYCIFSNGYKIVNQEFKSLWLKKLESIVAIEGCTVEIAKGKTFVDLVFICDNPFVKAICKMWKKGKISKEQIDKINYLLSKLKQISEGKGYVKIDDIENIAKKDSKVQEAYELIKRWMKQSDLS